MLQEPWSPSVVVADDVLHTYAGLAGSGYVVYQLARFVGGGGWTFLANFVFYWPLIYQVKVGPRGGVMAIPEARRRQPSCVMG